jgi:hypothetical protein
MMEVGFVVRLAADAAPCPIIFTTKAFPGQLKVRVNEEVTLMAYYPEDMDALGAKGVKFDPSEGHHRDMIDRYLTEKGLPRLTGHEWGQLRSHYRNLKRKKR